MSDFNSALPVRSETPGSISATIVDATTPSQGLAVDASGKITIKLDDAAGNGITSQVNGAQRALDVGIDVAGVQIDPRQIRSLTSADVVTASNFPTTVDTNYGAVGASTIRAASQIGNATGAADYNNGNTGAQTLRVAANLAIGGANVSTTNPIPVVFNVDPIGTEINDYNTLAALASAGTSNHDYTVTALKTLSLTQINASGSGKMKIEVQIETAAASNVFNTKFVQFNSTANPNMEITLKSPISVVAGARVRIIRTNKDNQAQDVYSTISGEETP